MPILFSTITYLLLGLLTEALICAQTTLSNGLLVCMRDAELFGVIVFWPIFAIGYVMSNPMPFVIVIAFLVVVVWLLIRQRRSPTERVKRP